MLSSAVKTGLDGFRRTIQDVADFRMGELFVFGKNQRSAKFFGESGDRFADDVGGFGGFDGLARIGRVVRGCIV